MSTSISDLKNALDTKTTKLARLSIASAGLFLFMWIYRHIKTIERILDAKLPSDTYLQWMAICAGLGPALIRAGQNEYGEISIISIIGILLQITALVLWIVLAFKLRDALIRYALHEYRFELHMNKFYTVVFNIFYINYCINDLPEILRKKQILNTAPDQAAPQETRP